MQGKGLITIVARLFLGLFCINELGCQLGTSKIENEAKAIGLVEDEAKYNKEIARSI